MATNKEILSRLDELEKKLPNGELKDLLGFRNNVTKALWILFTAVVGILVKLIGFG